MNTSSLARPIGVRVGVALGFAAIWTLSLWSLWHSDPPALVFRTVAAALVAALIHTILEHHPRTLAARGRRRMQLACTVLAIPITLALIYLGDTQPGRPPLWHDPSRLASLYVLSLTGALLAALAHLLAALRAERNEHACQRAIDAEALVQTQAELDDAQLRLLRLLIRPQLVLDLLRDARQRIANESSAAASLDRLLEYLRGALPHMNEARSGIGRELEQITAYLELLDHLLPNRLSWTIDVPDDARAIACPPRLLLVLAEQAVSRGGGVPQRAGRLEIWARVARARCLVRICDDGQLTPERLHALETLQRRLYLAEGDAVALRFWQRETGGCVVEIDLPQRPAPPHAQSG